jgi:hypothetical protein
VLEYLLADEELLLRFAVDSGLDPATIAKAHETLCGPMHLGDA